ncbi:MAG: hypothetical protein Q8P95_02370, partial [bacterium]|nr:hypothetical protein [bacterium]
MLIFYVSSLTPVATEVAPGVSVLANTSQPDGREEVKEDLLIVESEDEVTLSIDGGEIRTTYKHLGIETDPQTLEVVVDEEKLKQAILSFSPSLKLAEEMEEQFFAVPQKRDQAYTFNVAKLKRQLIASFERSQKATIEVERAPLEDHSEQAIQARKESEALQEFLQKKTLVLKSEAEDVQKLEWKIDLKDPDWIIQNDELVQVSTDKLREFFTENISGQLERP